MLNRFSLTAVGEPPVGLAVGALLSIKSAVEYAREEMTGERVFLGTGESHVLFMWMRSFCLLTQIKSSFVCSLEVDLPVNLNYIFPSLELT